MGHATGRVPHAVAATAEFLVAFGVVPAIHVGGALFLGCRVGGDSAGLAEDADPNVVAVGVGGTSLHRGS